MDPEKLKEIAARGGKAVKPELRSFSKNRELAVAAGKVGGVSVNPRNRPFSKNRDLAVAAGSKGGKHSRAKFANPITEDEPQ